MRNMGWNFIMLSQRPSFVPPIIRNNANIHVLFDVGSNLAFDHFRRDFVAGRVYDEDAYNALVSHIQRVPHTYLMFRNGPFDISAGNLAESRVAMTETSVNVPTMDELKKQLATQRATDAKASGAPPPVNEPPQVTAANMQVKVGNTSSRVRGTASRTREPEGYGPGPRSRAYRGNPRTTSYTTHRSWD
jgi:hypothetical protein